MMELDERPIGAAPAVRSHERAEAEIAQPHGALDLGRNVARSRCGGLRTPRLVGGGELLPREVREEAAEGAVEDGRLVAGRNCVSQHVLREPQLLESLAADRELDPVSVGGKGQRRHRSGKGWNRRRKLRYRRGERRHLVVGSGRPGQG
jgi:hypothetical protein